MISVKIIAVPSAIERLRERGPLIVEAIMKKMNSLMIRLQQKVVGEAIPTFFPKGAPNIAASVQFVPAEIQGPKIVGYVDAGGTPRTTKITLKSGRHVDYAIVQELGVPHGWEFAPFNKKALAFVLDGKALIRKKVWHPGLQPRPYMRSSINAMESTIRTELGEAFTESLGK